MVVSYCIGTIKDAYSLQKIQEIFDALKDTTIFSTIDLISGYHQNPTFVNDQEVTSFTIKYGIFYFNVIPFGLTNTSATFQREMNGIFFFLINNFVQIYLDDIIVYSSNVEQHLLDLKEVFNILRKHKLKLNIEKCHFYRYEVEALGHKVTIKGLLPIKKKVETISKMNIPNSITELRSFLGIVGYYRNFIDNYALISVPLCKLLRKNVEYVWTLEHTESFHKLINALVNAPILCYPRFDKPFIIRSDTSFNGIGSVLLQLYDDNIEHPVYFVSRSLTISERNYAIQN